MKWITNAPIVRRLLLASIIVAIIPGVILAFLGNAYIQSLNERSRAVQSSTDAVKLATTLLADLQRMNASVQAFHAERIAVANGLDTTDQQISQIEKNLSDTITSLQTQCEQGLHQYQQEYLFSSADEVASVRSLLANNSTFSRLASDQKQTLKTVMDTEWQAYIQAQNQEVQALQAKQTPAQLAPYLQAVDQKYQPLEQHWQHIVNLTEDVSDRVAQVDAHLENSMWLLTIAAIACIALLVVIVGYIVNLTIARPLRRLAFLTQRISGGETTARAHVAGNDEISLVASSINSMLDTIVHLIQVMQEQRNTLQGQIEKLVSEVSSVGEGNLRVRAEVTPTALGFVAESFNYMIKELNSLVIHVKAAASEVEHFTVLIFRLLTRLAETSNAQSQQIADATREVERMADFSLLVAEHAQALSETTRTAQAIVQKGRGTIQQATEGMRRIQKNIQETSGKVRMLDEHSREITNIVRVITNIAHQTNRLALDAAMQAAMVGEHGKGFRAVAIDIQRLAERTKGQATSINQIVQNVNEYIRQTAESMAETEQESTTGTRLTQQAGIALEAIFSSIERQTSEVISISQMTSQQLHSFNAIVQTIRDIASSTQQTSTSTREASRTVEHLAQMVEQLSASVEVFKVRDTQGQPRLRSRISGVISEAGNVRGHISGPSSEPGTMRNYLAGPRSDSGFGNFTSSNLLPLEE